MLKIISTFDATAIVPADSQGPYTVNAGSTVMFVPGATHPAATYEWDLGDGTQANTETVAHVYADDGIYVAKLKLVVNQPGGGTSRHFAIVNVKNVPPVVNAGPDQTVNEGDVISFTGTFTDVEYPDTHEATWDWGDSQQPDAGVVTETHLPPRSQGTVQGTHAWGDSGTYTVTLSVRDEDGGVGKSTLQMTVLNVPPTVDAGPDLYSYPCTTITLTGKFTDPGWLDLHTGTWDFGDCSPPQTAVIREKNLPPKGEGIAIASHCYHYCGTYSAICTVTDDDGAPGSDIALIRVVDVENRGFEEGFRTRGSGAVGNAWEPYGAEVPVFGGPPAKELDVSNGPTVFFAEEFPVHDGRRSQRVQFTGVMRYGIWQRIGANAGWDYEITVWYSIAEQSVSTARLGLDPTGGTDPTAASVVWSEGFERREWAQLAVRATAPEAGFITVFLEGRGGYRKDLPEGVEPQPTGRADPNGQTTCDVYFDDVALAAVQPFCPEQPPPKRGDTCVNFADLNPKTRLPAVFEKGGFTFESMDKGPQLIVAWGLPLGTSKLFVHAGVIIHLPFIADRVQLEGSWGGGPPLKAIARSSANAVVGQAVAQQIPSVQTLEINAQDIALVELHGGGESTLISVCAHPAKDSSGGGPKKGTSTG